QDDTKVFLISLKAGGTGLNLTGADVVIHYDPWWNMSAQNQATDRAHRLGQDKTVQVFKLMVKNTIEERIQVLQEQKRDLTEAIVKEGETFISKLSTEELSALFEEHHDF
ncbi:helicase, partial [Turicibacter sanguinis]|nr:helicase [Turicibacter sanguinis]